MILTNIVGIQDFQVREQDGQLNLKIPSPCKKHYVNNQKYESR